MHHRTVARIAVQSTNRLPTRLPVQRPRRSPTPVGLPSPTRPYGKHPALSYLSHRLLDSLSAGHSQRLWMQLDSLPHDISMHAADRLHPQTRALRCRARHLPARLGQGIASQGSRLTGLRSRFLSTQQFFRHQSYRPVSGCTRTATQQFTRPGVSTFVYAERRCHPAPQCSTPIQSRFPASAPIALIRPVWPEATLRSQRITSRPVADSFRGIVGEWPVIWYIHRNHPLPCGPLAVAYELKSKGLGLFSRYLTKVCGQAPDLARPTQEEIGEHSFAPARA